MATTLGSNKRHVEDTPNETVRLLRLEFNALCDFVLEIVNAATVNGDTFETAVEALDMTGINKIVATHERPTAPAHPVP
jgi:hypothetical protein